MSFDARQPGTDASAWRARLQAERFPALPLEGIASLVVLAAHPDDETLGAGALIARVAALGTAVTVVVASDGAGSHPHSPTHPPDALAAIRRDEVRAAVRALAPDASIVLLDLPDGRLADHRDDLTRALAELLEGADRPTLVAPWRQDGHPDHEVLGELAAAAAAERGLPLLEYPIWLWHWGDPDGQPLQALALPVDAPTRARVRGAIAAHRSQVEPLSDAPGDEAQLREDFLQNFDGDLAVFLVEQTPDRLLEDYFATKYARADDPWGFTTRWYEARKRQVTLAALPRPRFAHALELGASIGVLTAELAPRCDAVLAVDIAAAAVARARIRLADQPHVTVEQRDIADDFPDGEFDLVVLSEVGYYLEEAVLVELIGRMRHVLAADGVLVACHWRHEVGDYPLTGDRVHELLAEHAGLHRVVRHEEADFLLEVLAVRADSVAGREGLV